MRQDLHPIRRDRPAWTRSVDDADYVSCAQLRARLKARRSTTDPTHACSGSGEHDALIRLRREA